MLSHGNLMAMALCYPYDVDSVSASDAWLYAAPMSHGAGLYNFMSVRAGGRHVVPVSRGSTVPRSSHWRANWAVSACLLRQLWSSVWSGGA